MSRTEKAKSNGKTARATRSGLKAGATGKSGTKAAATKAGNKATGNKLAAGRSTGNAARADKNELNEGRKELRRGNLSRANQLLSEVSEDAGNPDASAARGYLGVLKGGLGYLRRPEGREQWPTGADDDFTQSLKDPPADSPLWPAWAEAQQGEARRIHVGSRFSVISNEAFTEAIASATESYNRALAQLDAAKDKSPTARQIRSWVLAHRGATAVLACMKHLEHGEIPQAQQYFTQAQADFKQAQARALTQVYPWASIFSAFLVSLRPRVFPESEETVAQAAAEGRIGFHEAISQSSDPRQRLQDVPVLLRGTATMQKRARQQLESTLAHVEAVQQALKQSLKELDKGKSAEAADRVESLLANELSGSQRFLSRCLAGMAYYAEQYDDSIRYGTLALQEDPFDGVTRYFVAASLLDKGDSLGQPVGQAMQQELHNQLELLVGLSLNLAFRAGPSVELKERLKEAGRGLVALAQKLAPPGNDSAGQDALAALEKLMDRVRPPNGPPDEHLKQGVMALLDALHGRAADERQRHHFEFVLFKHLKK